MPINNITQTISELPAAGRRGVDVQTTFVTKQEDFQDHLQGTTITELNTLKTQMNTMSGEMNTTASQVNTDASTATTKAGEASSSASSASTSASTATTQAVIATNASTKAGQWADNAYNVAVETGKYSAKHWSTVAQNATSGKIDKVTSTDNAVVRFDGATGEVQNSGVIIDDNGNVGIGVAPSSSLSSYKTLEVNGAVLTGHNSKTNAELYSNIYLDSSGVIRYLANSNATHLSMYQGKYTFNVAPSGTAGDAITWTNAMSLDTSGNLAVSGTISPNKIYIAPANNILSENLLLVGVSGLSNGLVVSKDTVSNMTLSFTNQTNTLCFKIDSAGNMQTPLVYNNITASAANIFMDSAGKFYRSTSSGRYKTDIETIDKTYVDTFFDNARPIYYKSLSDNDNPNWGYWGFIAEEIAEFDKRLVHWRFDTKDVEVEKERVIPAVEEQKDNEGNTIQESKNESIEKYIEIEKVNDESKPMIAEGVMYERITVLLTAKVQEQQELINSLISRIEALEVAR